MPSDEAHVAGSVMRNVLASARSLAGDDAVEQALAAMGPERAQELRDVMPAGWCRVGTAQTFHREMAAVLDEDLDLWFARVVREGLQRTFGSVWRVFLRIVSVSMLVKRGAAVYSKAYDRGTVKVEAVSADACTMCLADWPGVPALELDGVAIGIRTLLEMAGRERVEARWERTPDGARFFVRIGA